MPSPDTLTDKAIRSGIKAAVTCGKPAKISAGQGLVLDVRPTGSGWWRLRYRFDGREEIGRAHV